MFGLFGKKEEPKLATTQVIGRKFLVGSDLGYGQVKILDGLQKIKFLSAVGTPVSDFGRVAAMNSLADLLQALTMTYNGQKYYVGHNAIVNTRNGRLSLKQNKAESEENKIKFLTSLALLTDKNEEYAEFNIVTGLPVLEYKNQKESIFNMMYNGGVPFEIVMHYGQDEIKKTIKVNDVKVISQGEGAFYDFILDKDGNIIPEQATAVSGTVMVVDPGYKTTDVVTMENGRYIEPLSDQLNKGVNQMHQEILRMIMNQLNIKKELKDLDEIVRSGELYHNLKTHDVTDIIANAARPFAEDIVENLRNISGGELGGMQRVIMTGGGSKIIFPYVQALLAEEVEVTLMHDSEFCNASGYYKYGLLLTKAGQF